MPRASSCLKGWLVVRGAGASATLTAFPSVAVEDLEAGAAPLAGVVDALGRWGAHGLPNKKRPALRPTPLCTSLRLVKPRYGQNIALSTPAAQSLMGWSGDGRTDLGYAVAVAAETALDVALAQPFPGP